jgi:cupin 2 domain-containing protein
MPSNIFQNIPALLPDELFETLYKHDAVHIERIVSKGHATATDDWYDQAWDEWVLVLQGEAVLAYENQTSVNLKAGDYVLIPAHTKHKVAWTAAEIETIWLAVHIGTAT